ncbi:hypothetical protein ASZ90_009785 [hydrocarbon metagenome]|uniref:Uncharacterized protein n=1 Tax=hydrocarbon metagenome TaxID=938273 RepID=A0A0W8FHU0_9ZZZZ
MKKIAESMYLPEGWDHMLSASDASIPGDTNISPQSRVRVIRSSDGAHFSPVGNFHVKLSRFPG